jgi:hypothetical protein
MIKERLDINPVRIDLCKISMSEMMNTNSSVVIMLIEGFTLAVNNSAI